MNEILLSQSQVDESTESVKNDGLIINECLVKNWDLTHVLPELSNGNILDMGCYGSLVLANAVRMGIKGDKCGVDLNPLTEGMIVTGCLYSVGDMCNTNYPNDHFHTITCLSVVEHGVDINAFAMESSRLLKSGGSLMVTCDYWPDRYQNLPGGCFIFCKEDLERLIETCNNFRLLMTEPMNWEYKDKVIDASLYYPVKDVGYTFAYLKFVKS